MSSHAKSDFPASYGKLRGEYPFFLASERVKRCNNPSLTGDSLIVSTGGRFLVHRGKGDYSISMHCKAIFVKDNLINIDYLRQWMVHNSRMIHSRGFEGTALRVMKLEFLYGLQISLPSLENQEFVSTILEDVDINISNIEVLLNKERSSFQGLLNQLMSYGIQSTTVDWVNCNLGEVLKERKERGDGTLPLHSVTLHRGLVPRIEMNRHISSEMNDDQNAIVRKGDLAYNMMRMWQGGSGIAQEDCLVSPAYVVCRPTEAIDSDYLGYLVKSDRMLRHFIAHSEGVAKDRWRLYYRNLARIPVELPPIEEQREIAKILKAQDEVIASIEADLLKLKRIKHNLADDLLMGRVAMSEEVVAHA